MKIAQLQYFTVVCRHMNMTKAAEAMRVTQPAMTVAIRELEEELGVLLLHRSGRRIAVTEAGEMLLRRGGEILENIEDLKAAFVQMRESANYIRIGIPPMIGTFLFPLIFQSYHEKFPEIRLSVEELGSLDATRAVKEGKTDLAIITMDETPPSGLDAQTVQRSQLTYCVGPSHRLARRKEIAFAEIDGDPLILFKSGFYHRELLNREFQRHSMTPKVVMTSTQLLTMKSFARQGIASCFMMPEVVLPGDGLAAIPFIEPLFLNVAVVWRKGSFLTREAQDFIRFVKTTISALE